MMPGGQPLVTFALLSYNQERFIREAVESAFAQEYRPLEILLSDDCSADGTFEIMREMAAGYRGSHTVVLNRNATNLGIGGHVNKIMEMAKGELIVAAAGDDVSLPHRTTRLVKFWLEGGRPSALCSRVQVVDARGEPLDSSGWDAAFYRYVAEAEKGTIERLRMYVRDHTPEIAGATEAWSRGLFEAFGNFGAGLVQEDRALALRAWLLNGIGYLDEPLVLYRTHGENVWYRRLPTNRSVQGFRKLEDLLSFRLRSELTLLIGFRRDLLAALKMGILPWPMYGELMAEIRRQTRVAYLRGYWWTIPWRKRVCYAITIFGRGGEASDKFWAMPRLAPELAFLFIRSWASRTRSGLRTAANLFARSGRWASRLPGGPRDKRSGGQRAR